MDRRRFIGTLAGGLLAAPLAAQAQQGVYRIGYLTVPGRESAHSVADAFELALRDLGWINGKNVVVDYRFANNDMERVASFAGELVQARPDVIVAGANAAVAALKNATQTIPIVMFLAADPVRSGLVASLARPGGNITGLTVTTGPELYGKQLQLLKSAFPKISRVAIVANRASPVYAGAVREIEIATHALGLRQQIVEIRAPEEFEVAFATLARRAEAIFVPADSLFYQYRVRIAQLAVKTRLPAMWGLREQAEAGGLMAYATDLHDLGRRAATYVDKILRGAKPANLPVEQPTKFELVINLKTAKALGLTISPSLLARADQVIE
ncbi:MAG TPA: ABC transporter substrate-binding protein [Methylomirabilota bacterium]|nr:ABC transporter substrate-binding protein [Methylomirabilota bacterium]